MSRTGWRRRWPFPVNRPACRNAGLCDPPKTAVVGGARRGGAGRGRGARRAPLRSAVAHPVGTEGVRAEPQVDACNRALQNMIIILSASLSWIWYFAVEPLSPLSPLSSGRGERGEPFQRGVSGGEAARNTPPERSPPPNRGRGRGWGSNGNTQNPA